MQGRRRTAARQQYCPTPAKQLPRTQGHDAPPFLFGPECKEEKSQDRTDECFFLIFLFGLSLIYFNEPDVYPLIFGIRRALSKIEAMRAHCASDGRSHAHHDWRETQVALSDCSGHGCSRPQSAFFLRNCNTAMSQ